MNLSVVAVENLLKSNIENTHICIAIYAYLRYQIDMNKFEFKNLVKSLEKSLKERTFFKTLRTEVNTGANGTQDYVVKKGINKDKIATTRQ
jgi:hypothetical protein